MLLKRLLNCFWRGIVNTINHDGIEHAGYLAFLGLLAIFPFLVFVVAIIGVVGQDTTSAAYLSALFEKLPPEITRALNPRVLEITSGPPQGLLTLAVLGAIWTASSAVEGLRTTLNRAYHVHTPPAYWFRRSMSVLQLLVFAFILACLMMLLVGVPILIQNLRNFFDIPHLPEAFTHLIFLLKIIIPFVFVSWMYYVIPNIKQKAISVFPGALLVVVLWRGTAALFVYYLNNFNQVNVIYGSLGGVIAALVFFYLCNMIFIFGAEFNYLISQAFGMKIEEKETV